MVLSVQARQSAIIRAVIHLRVDNRAVKASVCLVSEASTVDVGLL